VQVGDVVSLRVVTRVGPTDVVGTLLAVSADALTVRRRDGTVTQVTRASVAAGRVVPPGPARRIGVAELQRTAALGWRALETEPLGQWWLRASGGFTRRGNSALAHGDPGVPPRVALDRVTDWYAARGLRPRLQIVTAETPADLLAELDTGGWTTEAPTEVMTAELGPVLRSAVPPAVGADVRLAPEPDAAWLATYRPGTPEGLPDVARQVLVNHDDVTFASMHEGGRCVAVARATVDGRWAGLSCVEVVADRRRHGLGTAVSVGALRWAVGRSARRGWLQVEVGNDAARAVYDRLGFGPHHEYVYRTSPEPSVASTA
jgi:GNAT superfamily N-acetyltransferase